MESLIQALLGIAVGPGGAVAASRLMSSLLFGVSALDPMTFVGATGLLAAVALAASAVPARRAAAVDPAIALRHE
jgi:putative ABC transport system permease protein